VTSEDENRARIYVFESWRRNMNLNRKEVAIHARGLQSDAPILLFLTLFWLLASFSFGRFRG